MLQEKNHKLLITDETDVSVAKERLCKCCGRTFTPNIFQPIPWRLHYEYGYGSQYDLMTIDIELCPNCADRITDYLVNTFKINPLIERLITDT